LRRLDAASFEFWLLRWDDHDGSNVFSDYTLRHGPKDSFADTGAGGSHHEDECRFDPASDVNNRASGILAYLYRQLDLIEAELLQPRGLGLEVSLELVQLALDNLVGSFGIDREVGACSISAPSPDNPAWPHTGLNCSSRLADGEEHDFIAGVT
jgi:hypothetical protein